MSQAETQLADDKTAQQSISQAPGSADQRQGSGPAERHRSSKPASKRQGPGRAKCHRRSDPAGKRQVHRRAIGQPSPKLNWPPTSPQAQQSVSQAQAQLATDKSTGSNRSTKPRLNWQTTRPRANNRSTRPRSQLATDQATLSADKATMALDKSSLSADQEKEAVDCKGNGAAGGVIANCQHEVVAVRHGRLGGSGWPRVATGSSSFGMQRRRERRDRCPADRDLGPAENRF